MKTVADRLRHAFAMPDDSRPLTVEETALLERLAETVVRRRMAVPAALLLESVAPLNFLGSQALHFFSPLIELAVPSADVDQVARLLERRDSLHRLAQLIEQRAAKSSSPR